MLFSVNFSLFDGCSRACHNTDNTYKKNQVMSSGSIEKPIKKIEKHILLLSNLQDLVYSIYAIIVLDRIAQDTTELRRNITI